MAHLRHSTWRPSRAGTNLLDQSSIAKIEERCLSINYFLIVHTIQLIREAAAALLIVHRLEPTEAYELGSVAGRLIHVEELRVRSALLLARHLLRSFRGRRDHIGSAIRKLLVFTARLGPRDTKKPKVISLREHRRRHEAPKVSLSLAAEEAHELGWPYHRFLRCAVQSWWSAV